MALFSYNHILCIDYPILPYNPGSYEGRSFFYDNDHLGEDIKLEEGKPVKIASLKKTVGKSGCHPLYRFCALWPGRPACQFMEFISVIFYSIYLLISFT